jgi:hypothetical protein
MCSCKSNSNNNKNEFTHTEWSDMGIVTSVCRYSEMLLEVISRNETMIHLYGVPAPFRLGRTASLRARRYPLG